MKVTPAWTSGLSAVAFALFLMAAAAGPAAGARAHQPTPSFPTLIPTPPYPTLPPDVPTPAPLTPTPSPSATRTSTSTATMAPTRTPSPPPPTFRAFLPRLLDGFPGVEEPQDE